MAAKTTLSHAVLAMFLGRAPLWLAVSLPRGVRAPSDLLRNRQMLVRCFFFFKKNMPSSGVFYISCLGPANNMSAGGMF